MTRTLRAHALDRPPPAPRRAAGRVVAAALYACMQLVMDLAARAHFARIHVIGRGRFPAAGPVVLVANHPATWTDVVVLDVALRRKLHFLARDTLFRPWPRSLLLGLYGAIRVHTDPADPDRARRNRDAFRSAHARLDEGAVVAVFPEGRSGETTRLLPLHTGAARIALERVRRGGRPAPLIPVALHYDDRTALGGDATVSVGEAVDVGAQDALAAGDADADADARPLTDAIDRALRGIMLDLGDPALAELVPIIAALEPSGLHGAGASGFERARAVRERLVALRARDPAAFATLRRHARGHARRLAALGVRDEAMRGAIARGPRRALRAGALAVPALAGLLLHAVPGLATEWIVRATVRRPTRIAFVRISIALGLFPAWYLALALGAPALGGPAWSGVALAALAIALGPVALEGARAVRAELALRRARAIARLAPRPWRRALDRRARLLARVHEALE